MLGGETRPVFFLKKMKYKIVISEGCVASGISKTEDTNYLKIRDYYGVNFPDDTFEEDVKEFLTSKHNQQ